jgi:homoserine kinase
MALELYTVVEFMPVQSGLMIELSGEGAKDLARDHTNLVYRAAKSVFEAVTYQPQGIKIRISSSIPPARGLGSSAAAIIGGVLAANILSGNRLGNRELLNLAAGMEGHPDNVTPALCGGIIVAVPVEGDVRYVKIAPPAGLKVVIAVPDFQLPTMTAREALPQQVTMQDAVFNLGRVALLVAALQQGDLSMLGTAMEDRLHQPYRANLIPGMKKVLAAARLAGARGVTLSGSGPTLVAFADNNFELIARVMKDTFRQNGVTAKVMVINPSPVGARALEIK